VIQLDKCKWLPDIVECTDFAKWNEYLDNIYEIFRKDFIENKPIFENRIVNYRRAPMDGKYEHTFIHLTHKDEFNNSSNPNDRIPDPRRSERIKWNKKIIENYICEETCNGCEKILYFEEYNGNNIKVYLLFKDEKFLVILEKRRNYNLIITGYYIYYDNAMDKYIKKYELYKKQKTPLI
jgi:hypothetical protein